MIIMAINGLWYVMMVYIFPVVFDLYATFNPDTCFWCVGDDDSADMAPGNLGGSSRRQLGGAAVPQVCQAELLPEGDVCKMNSTELEAAANMLADRNSTDNYWQQCEACLNKKDDIPADDTFIYTVMFIAIGWIVALNQAFIVLNLARRMRRVLEFNGALDDDNIVELLKKLQKDLLPRNRAAAMAAQIQDKLARRISRDNGGRENDTDDVHADSDDLHTVNLEDDDDDDEEADKKMIFRHNDELKDSDDILSIKTFGWLMFVSMTWQLVIDFYVSFYWVHMAQRVPKAFGVESMLEGHYAQQLGLHVLIIAPVVFTLYLLMVTTRQLALLRGVLHLDEDAVSDVLQHMDRVRDIRARIRDTLSQSKPNRTKKDVKKAKALLAKAELGELVLLQQLAKRTMKERLTRVQMMEMVRDNENVTISTKKLRKYLDRSAAAAFLLESRADQATAMTAKTLEFDESSGDSSDTIEAWDFSTLIVRKLADIIGQAAEMCAPPEDLEAFQAKITALDSVDDDMIDYGQRLSQAKLLFKQTDKDGSGGVSRNELYGALKRFRVMITKSEFKDIFRVIDPDQSYTMSLDEWVDFMMASDADFEAQTLEADQVRQQMNAKKGNNLGQLAGEGAGFLMGATVGGLVGGVVGKVENVVDGTLDLVGDGLDTVGLGFVAVRSLRCV
jgi:hypothetical protein